MIKLKTISVLALLATVTLSKAQNYISYHQQIYKIEQYIHQKNYRKAVILYQKIFSTYKNTFYQDLNNAFYAAILANEKNVAIQLFKKLILKGYTLKNFDQNKLKNAGVFKECSAKYSELRQAYLSNIDSDRRNFFYKIYQKDQYNAIHKGEYGQATDTVWYNNAKLLCDDYLKHGFPSFVTSNDTLRGSYLVILRHYFGMLNTVVNDDALLKDSIHIAMDFERLDWKRKLEEGVRKGEIDPEFYQVCVEYRDFSNPFGALAAKIDFKKEIVEPMWPLLSSDSKKIKVNTYRQKSGLPPITDTVTNIQNTWLKKYPFKESKIALKNCKECRTQLDTVNLISDIRKEAKRLYKKVDANVFGFKLRGKVEVKEFYYFNLNAN